MCRPDGTNDKLEMLKRNQPDAHPVVAPTWGPMTTLGREFIRNGTFTAQQAYEQVRILGRLAKRLQQVSPGTEAWPDAVTGA
jgi:hypothetical protein